MIEKIELLFDMRSQNDARMKINELVEASNRQDRAISFILKGIYMSDIQKALPADSEYWEELRRGT